MTDLATYVPELLRLVRQMYPDWTGFSHPQFATDELEYKRDAAAFAREHLDRDILQSLLDQGDTAEFITRLKAVAGKTNMLYLGTPRTGDLAPINQPDSDLGAICRAVYALLHGPGDAADRLGAFCDFIVVHNLPQKWTFPTYYLFLLYPDSEIFIKPGRAQWLSDFTQGAIPYMAKPSAATYAAIRAGFHALREELSSYGATDMIDVQSMVYVAHGVATKGEATDAFAAAVERLRAGLPTLVETPDLAAIQRGRDEVYARYGHSFTPERLPELTADEYLSFLRFENNHHWTGINRHGSRTVQDMPALRAALAILLDEGQPLAERYDQATGGMAAGVGRAIATAVLHVVYPERYGVWNTKVEAGLRELDLHPDRAPKATDGQVYAAVNEVLRRLAAALEIDLWTLDNLWEWMARRRTLATPFDKIFADRAQAEWAFDLFADAVERLGGGPDDPRFTLTRYDNPPMLRLNIGNSMVIDIGSQGKRLNLTALKEAMKQSFAFSTPSTFRVTSKGTAQEFGVYTIPADFIRDWPPNLQSIFEQSMETFGKEFETWERSNLRRAHSPEIFESLFDMEKREYLFANGLQSGREIKYWRITMPSDLSDDLSNDRGPYNLWAECLRRGVAAIDFDNDFQHPQVKKFAQIAPGDRVVAFLRNRTIGGIGVVTSPFDEKTARERPADRDFFRGGFWQRVGVDWTAKDLDVEKLPKAVQNKFGQSTVLEINESDFAEVEKLMNEFPPSGRSIANEFKGFTADAFAFLRELAANNNKAWMAANRERWRDSVLEPMRALFSDLGPRVKELFDPYLLPDELEIAPTAHKVLARINKNWSATPDSKYHEYYWGAFFRQSLSRQTDAQLFITMFSYQMRFGFFVGRGASLIRNRFRDRVMQDPEGFYGLIADLGLAGSTQYGWSFESGEREIVSVRSSADLIKWVDSGDYDLLRVLPPEQVVNQGPALADTILDTFRRVFPVYLWAVSDEPEDLIERYLAAEFPDPDPDEEVEPPPPPYTFTDFTHHTHLTDARAAELEAMLKDKRQAIFYGPPGTGKTYVARHLAKLITELADPPPEQLTIVQFHPAYGYEEFIEGIRPKGEKSDDGRTVIDYPVRPGAFVRFCRTAAQQGDKPCVFIIDEINRGNIPRIFGELMYLLEYRDQRVPLPYSGDRFRIPPNVYLIGTMNTADRSIALVDFALRRRFHFAHFAADPDLYDRWLAANPPRVPYLGALYRALATTGTDDPDYAIGPSVFMDKKLDENKLRRVWEWSVMPYLREYHIERSEAIGRWEWDSAEMLELRGRAIRDELGEDIDA